MKSLVASFLVSAFVTAELYWYTVWSLDHFRDIQNIALDRSTETW